MARVLFYNRDAFYVAPVTFQGDVCRMGEQSLAMKLTPLQMAKGRRYVRQAGVTSAMPYWVVEYQGRVFYNVIMKKNMLIWR